MKLIFRLYYSTSKLLYRIGLLCLVLFQVEGQNLCNSESNPNLIPDGFEIEEGNVGCHPFKVSVKNKLNNARDVQYIYYYGGQSVSELKNLNPTSDLSNIYFVESGEKYSDYTILQFGKDENGKDFYSCKNVAVRLSNEPKFSYTICNGSSLTVNIPKDEINNFDSYILDINNDKISIDSSELPYSLTKTVSLPSKILLEGNFVSPQSGCPSPKSTIIESYSSSGNPEGQSRPYHPNIEKIEMNSGASGVIYFNGAFDDKGYEIYKTEKNKPYNSIPFLTGQQPGEILFDIEDSTKSYCFYAIRNISCGIEQSAEICTVPLFDPVAIEKENLLQWTPYKERQYDWPNQPEYGRFLEKSTSILISENEADYLEINVPSSPQEYFDSINCSNSYCYRIKVKTSGQLYRFNYEGESISAEKCISRKTFRPDSLTNIVATVEAENPTIEFIDNSTWGLDKEAYFLYTSKDSSSFYLVDSLSTPGVFHSNFNSGASSFCFKIAYRDECGSLSKLSPEVCTVFLEADKNIDLLWTEESPFVIDSIVKLEVISLEEKSGIERVVYSQENMQTNTISPDLNEFENEAKYFLKIYGYNSLSQSNLISIPISTKLFIPDVFSPNGDGINDLFKIYGNFGTLDSFDLKIIDRLGYLIFSSNDPKNYWDGTHKGVSSPSGYYNYIITGTTQKGEPIVKQGKLLLLQ